MFNIICHMEVLLKACEVKISTYDGFYQTVYNFYRRLWKLQEFYISTTVNTILDHMVCTIFVNKPILLIKSTNDFFVISFIQGKMLCLLPTIGTLPFYHAT